MTPDFSIEACRAEDVPALLPLLRQLRPSRAVDAERVRAAMQQGLESGRQIYVCARAAGVVIGFGSLTLKNNLWPEGPIGNVDELVVDAAHRGRGLGRTLLEHLAAAARQRGCRRLELDSGLHRAEAHAFYKSLGFETRALLFTLRI